MPISRYTAPFTTPVPLSLGGSGSAYGLNWLNTKDYGAVGDGSVDDSEAVQAALNDAAGASASGTVYFPPGVYKLNVIVPPCVNLIGARSPGRVEAFSGDPQIFIGETRFIPNATGAAVVKIPYLKGNSIKHVRFFGPGAYTAGSIGLDVRDDDNDWAGTGLNLDGVEFIHFDRGCWYIANRGYFEHCSFVGCNRGFDTSGAVTFPADTLVFTSCSGGGARLSAPGVLEVAPDRTGVGWYIGNGGVKGVNFIGCEMGQCGTAVYLGPDYPYVSIQGSNFEGNDLGAIKMESGALSVAAVNAYCGALPFVDVIDPGATADIVMRACRVSTTYPAAIRTTQARKPLCVPAQVIEYTTDFTRTVPSTGERMQLSVSNGNITITTGTTDFTVAFDTVDYGTANHFNGGEWRCPRNSRYRMRVRMTLFSMSGLTYWYIGYANTPGGATAATQGTVIRKPAPVGNNEFVEGTIEFQGVAGKYYRVMGVSDDAAFTIMGGSDPVTGGPQTFWNIEELTPTD